METAVFEVGREYRRKDLHERYGGQQRGGISTPRDQPMVWLFTGSSGEAYGYRDGFQDDGTFWYTGEGQVGDMQMSGGNLAIREHADRGKELHLFEIPRKRFVKYIGRAFYLGQHLTEAPDREGNLRSAIVFELELDADPDATTTVDVEALADIESRRKRSLAELRRIAMMRPPAGSTSRVRRVVTHARSRAVREYVLRRAAGICEACRHAAPFERLNGTPYLEPHHIRRVADGGPDHPRWVAGICPNCHREIHHGKNGDQINEVLAGSIGELEMED